MLAASGLDAVAVRGALGITCTSSPKRHLFRQCTVLFPRPMKCRLAERPVS